MDERIVCNKLNVRHVECRDVLQKVMQVSSKAMTLATKFGSYFLIGLLESGESIPLIVGKDIFWRWCVEMVTHIKSEPTTELDIKGNRDIARFRIRRDWKRIPRQRLRCGVQRMFDG